MIQKSIVVSVDTDGTVTIEAIGFKGQACNQATAAIEKALGQVKSSRRKPEAYQHNAQQQQAGR